ncbi:hypothetical protein C6H68_22150 [Photorhabdus luminescens]|nr:hypothetical protein C6H68_22150 [Photorhabdus luminescens]
MLGRATALDDADVSSTLTYDGLGQVTRWTATNKHNGYQKITTLTRDEYGRETQRTIETRDAGNTLKDTLTVVQAWSKKTPDNSPYHDTNDSRKNRDPAGRVLRLLP